MSHLKILIVDDDEKARKNMERHLKNDQPDQLQVFAASNIEEARVQIEDNYFDVIVTDMNMEENKSAGLEVLKISRDKDPSMRVIIITAFGNSANGWYSGRQGAYAYVEKQANDSYDILRLKVEEALRFDVFITYKSADRENAMNVTKLLKHHGIRPWIDVERILPGQKFEDIIKNGIEKCRSVAVLIGIAGLGNWQRQEIDLLWETAKLKPIIPVLLPGVIKLPDNLGLLKNYSYIHLNKCINEGCSNELFIRGITGKHFSIKD